MVNWRRRKRGRVERDRAGPRERTLDACLLQYGALRIARLFDGGVTTDGLPYYTMAYCEGGSLANRLRQAGTLPVAEALRARLRRLSDAWALISNFGYDRPRPSFARARAAALRALALDSTLADARASLGHTLCTEDYAWAAAERELRRAIDQDPTYAFARTTYAVCLMSTGRNPEAVAQLDTARRLDPLRVGIGALLGRAYVNWGRPDEAIAALDQAIDLNPQADLAWQ